MADEKKNLCKTWKALEKIMVSIQNIFVILTGGVVSGASQS